jgi:hypothetical protein
VARVNRRIIDILSQNTGETPYAQGLEATHASAVIASLSRTDSASLSQPFAPIALPRRHTLPRVDLRAENAYCGVPFRCFSCAERSALHWKRRFA